MWDRLPCRVPNMITQFFRQQCAIAVEVDTQGYKYPSLWINMALRRFSTSNLNHTIYRLSGWRSSTRICAEGRCMLVFRQYGPLWRNYARCQRNRRYYPGYWEKVESSSFKTLQTKIKARNTRHEVSCAAAGCDRASPTWFTHASTGQT